MPEVRDAAGRVGLVAKKCREVLQARAEPGVATLNDEGLQPSSSELRGRCCLQMMDSVVRHVSSSARGRDPPRSLVRGKLLLQQVTHPFDRAWVAVRPGVQESALALGGTTGLPSHFHSAGWSQRTVESRLQQRPTEGQTCVGGPRSADPTVGNCLPER